VPYLSENRSKLTCQLLRHRRHFPPALHLEVVKFLRDIRNFYFPSQLKYLAEFLFPHELIHGGDDGFGLGLLPGQFLTSEMRSSGMFNVARIFCTSAICIYFISGKWKVKVLLIDEQFMKLQ